MRVKIVALSTDDGWAIAEWRDKLYVLRPYNYIHNRCEYPVTEQDVAKAIGLHGFKPCEHIFPNWQEAIHFLKDVYVKAIQSRGIPLPTDEDLKELLKYVPDETLLRFLDKAEALIPDNKAVAIISDILGLRQTEANPEIHARCEALLDRIGEEIL